MTEAGTHVMLKKSITLKYACAVLKLHGPDSHSTPYAWQMMPAMEITTGWRGGISTCVRAETEKEAYRAKG